jgi:hypothetical protein
MVEFPDKVIPELFNDDVPDAVNQLLLVSFMILIIMFC